MTKYPFSLLLTLNLHFVFHLGKEAFSVLWCRRGISGLHRADTDPRLPALLVDSLVEHPSLPGGLFSHAVTLTLCSFRTMCLGMDLFLFILLGTGEGF